MGDRAMAEIKTMQGSLYVYTHWGGTSLPENARRAISIAESRWGDTPYALRIIVDQLTKEGRDQETGFGLMLTPNAEDSYNSDMPSVVIDLQEQTLTILRYGEKTTIAFQELLQ